MTTSPHRSARLTPAPESFAVMPIGRRATRSIGVRYAFALLLLLGAFLADLNTGYSLSASLFYVLPVAFTAWFVGRRQGLLVAVASAATWFTAQRLGDGSRVKPGILYANAGVECGIYLGAAWVVARVNEARIVERRLTRHVTDARDALEREFLAVGELQRGLLPRHLPRLAGYEWAVHYITSTRAGGDYYDAFELPDGRVGVMVADASGHGAPAAVLMAMAKALLAADPDLLLTPEATLARLNRQLGRVLPPGWFMTACYLVIDPASGRCTYSVAGHEPPLVVRAPDGSVTPATRCGGLPLGPFPDHGYGGGRVELNAGDTLVLFTDGVTETMSPARELFGLERLCATLARSGDAPLESLKFRLLAALDEHAAGAPIEDDTTLLLLRRSA